MAASSNVIVGTWFPSGYHGHFRSKSRLDYLNEYRHLSKPMPPAVFLDRSKLKPTVNVFSKHDNRHSFVNNAIYFEGGLGLRRFKSAQGSQPDMLRWIPEKKEWDKSPPQHSVYRVTYTETPAKPIKELIVKRPKTSFDPDVPMMTSYRYSHGDSNPNRALIDAMNNSAMSTFSSKRGGKHDSERESVANCLNWNIQPTKSAHTIPQRPNRPQVCAATEPVTLLPHPPTAPQAAPTAPQAAPIASKVRSSVVTVTPSMVTATSTAVNATVMKCTPTVVCRPFTAPPRGSSTVSSTIMG